MVSTSFIAQVWMLEDLHITKEARLLAQTWEISKHIYPALILKIDWYLVIGMLTNTVPSRLLQSL